MWFYVKAWADSQAVSPGRLDQSVTLFQSEINGGSENQSSRFVGKVSDAAG